MFDAKRLTFRGVSGADPDGPTPAAWRAAYPLTRIAAAARMKATPVMSLRASPAWNSTRLCEPSATEAPISACGAAPYGLPMHQAASSATDSQPRLSTGETMSRSKNRIGTAWRTSEFAG